MDTDIEKRSRARQGPDDIRLLYLPEIGTVAEVGHHLRKSPSAVRKLIKDGVIPARKIGRRWYITRRRLLALFEDGASPASLLLRELLEANPSARVADRSRSNLRALRHEEDRP